MAATTTTTANDVYLAAQVSSLILNEVRPADVSFQFLRREPLTMSKAQDFPIQADPGAAAAGVEGTDNTDTALSTDKATATAGTVVLMATVTDELNAISIVDAYSHFGGVLARSVAEKKEVDAAALWAAFSNTTSTSGVDLTVAKFIEAKGALIARDIFGTYVSVLHPVQTTDLQQDMATSTAAAMGGSIDVNGKISSSYAGFQFELAGVPVYQSTAVNTANSGADRAGAIFAANQACGAGVTWDTRVELERDASLPGTEIVATANYGVIEIRDADGQTLITDA